jgi:hypothetical protein
MVEHAGKVYPKILIGLHNLWIYWFHIWPEYFVEFIILGQKRNCLVINLNFIVIFITSLIFSLSSVESETLGIWWIKLSWHKYVSIATFNFQASGSVMSSEIYVFMPDLVNTSGRSNLMVTLLAKTQVLPVSKLDFVKFLFTKEAFCFHHFFLS